MRWVILINSKRPVVITAIQQAGILRDMLTSHRRRPRRSWPLDDTCYPVAPGYRRTRNIDVQCRNFRMLIHGKLMAGASPPWLTGFRFVRAMWSRSGNYQLQRLPDFPEIERSK